MGLREIILTAVAVLAAYLLYLLLRLVRPARSPAPVEEGAVEPAVAGSTLRTAGPGEEFFRLQFELQQLRGELTQRDAAVQALQADVAALQASVQEIVQRVDAVPGGAVVAPQYGEAMLLARRGLDAATIAERCSISMGEADLVRALAQRGEGKA